MAVGTLRTRLWRILEKREKSITGSALKKKCKQKKQILANNQLDALPLMYLFILPLYMFRASSAHHQEINCINRSSGVY